MKKAATLVLLLTLGYGAFHLLAGEGASGASSGEPGLIDGRVWVDSRPEKLVDYVHVAFFLGQVHLGLFERASSYDLRLEQFDFKRDGRTVTLTFPQTGRTVSFAYTVASCAELKPFDLCLDLSENPWGGPRRYYGFTSPEDEARELGSLAAPARARLVSARAD